MHVQSHMAKQHATSINEAGEVHRAVLRWPEFARNYAMAKFSKVTIDTACFALQHGRWLNVL